MKKILIPLFAFTLVAFSVKRMPVDKSSATVNQVQGLYIFVDSRPVSEYDFLGAIEIKHAKGGPQYQPVRDALIKELRNKYPQADGAILHFINGARDKADAIKFK